MGPTRDLAGYGRTLPRADWPGDARVAVNLVLNFEEGAEYSVLNGDAHSETILSDLGGLTPLQGERDLNIESLYEYGSRIGVWRILRTLEERRLPFTVYAVGQALEANPDAAAAFAAADCDVVSHGWRWIDYRTVPAEVERAHIGRCVETITRLTGRRPIGWYTGRPSANTRRLVVEEGGFLYDCDAYNDDLPYWVEVEGKPHLVICHSFDCNDSRFSRGQGFDVADDFFTYLKDTFACLYEEGAERPRIMTIGLHCRLVGRPGRIAGLARFLDYATSHDRVWFCRRDAIAQHWIEHHPHGRD